MKEIALHILDVVENSLTAGATTIEIVVEEDAANNRLRLTVRDDGRGMEARKLAALGDPFVTSRTTRVAGLGLPLLKAAAEACNGRLGVHSAPGEGTTLTAEFQRDHIDRMPLGDLAGTLLSLVVGSPEIRWRFQYRADGRLFSFDTDPFRRALGDIPLCEPAVLTCIRETLEEGIRDVMAAPA
jgi:hypothetical protein